MSRRFVVGIAAAILAVMVLGGIIIWAVGGGGSPRTAALEESRRTNAVSWYLYGGPGGQTFWGDLESVAGCDAQGDVAILQEQTGETEKHISEAVSSACRLQVVVNSRATTALYGWINNALSETHTRQDLTLLKRSTYTSSSNQDMSISLQDALIERIELPHFQTSPTGAATATVTLTVRPEQTTRDNNPGVPSPPSGNSAPLPATSFVVDVGAIAQVSASRFEPWSAAVGIVREAGANVELGQPLYRATETSLGDLGFSVPLGTSAGATDANQLHSWFQQLVIQNQGAPDPSEERTLTLTARHPQTAATLLTVTFTNVGIFAQPSYALGNDPEKFLLYTEGASFAPGP